MSVILEAFKVVAPYINELSINDIAVTVAGKEKYVAFVRSKHIPQLVNRGDEILEGSVVKDCMNTGQRVVKKVPDSVAGFPYIACGIPIEENGEIVGAISFLSTIDKQERLIEISEKLEGMVQELMESSQAIDTSSGELIQIAEAISRIAESLSRNVEETDKIINMIQKVSKQTNMLGLNASIEAVRAGSQGRGFAVVAQEIRKLAVDTSESLTAISGVLSKIKFTSQEESAMVTEIDAVIQDQAGIAAQINRSVEALKSHTQILMKDAENLLEE